MANYTFVNSEIFYLLVLPFAILIWQILKHKTSASAILFSGTEAINNKPTLKQQLRQLPFLLKIGAASLMIIALARPQSSTNWEESTTEGIEIILAMDISGSMLAQDLKPDRLEASKNVAMDFISKRKNEREKEVLEGVKVEKGKGSIVRGRENGNEKRERSVQSG